MQLAARDGRTAPGVVRHRGSHRLPGCACRDAGARGGDPQRRSARAGVAGGTPAAVHRRHLGAASRADRSDPLPHLCRRARRAVDLSRPRPARGLRDAGPDALARHGAREGCALLRARAGGVADPRAGPVQRARRAAGRPRRDLGGRPRDRDRGQDRRHRRAGQPLGKLARRGAEHCAGPDAFQQHRAMRHRRARGYQPGGARHPGNDGTGRRGATSCMAGGIRQRRPNVRRRRELYTFPPLRAWAAKSGPRSRRGALEGEGAPACATRHIINGLDRARRLLRWQSVEARFGRRLG